MCVGVDVGNRGKTFDAIFTWLVDQVLGRAKDQKRLAATGDHLQEICEDCHTKYRPQMPTDGVSRHPFYPKRQLQK